MDKMKIRLIALGVIAFVMLMVGLSCFKVIETGERGVVLRMII